MHPLPPTASSPLFKPFRTNTTAATNGILNGCSNTTRNIMSKKAFLTSVSLLAIVVTAAPSSLSPIVLCHSLFNCDTKTGRAGSEKGVDGCSLKPSLDVKVLLNLQEVRVKLG